MQKIIKILILSLAIFSSFLYSKTINVPNDAKSIQDAINLAEIGDIVLVSPGIYRENINFQGKNIIVASLFFQKKDPEFIKNTIIDGSSPKYPDIASCVSFISGEDCDAVLQGFTLMNGSGSIRTESNGTFWREGGGIFIMDSSPTIKNNLITKNKVIKTGNVSSTGGGGISCIESYPRILNNIIMLNQARYAAGIMVYHSGVELKNNIICQNSGGQDYGGGGIVVEGKGPGPKIIENNTIVANASSGSGFYGGRAGGLLVFKASIIARNNIIWGNIQNNGEQVYVHQQLTEADFTYNNIDGGWEGNGNINTSPGFLKRAFKLTGESSCVDKGAPDFKFNDPASPSNPSEVVPPAKGGPRNDMGAFGGPGAVYMAVPNVEIPAEPYSGIPLRIPGRIEAEAFNWSFKDMVIGSCSDFGGGYYISLIRNGKGVAYSVDVEASGTYDLVVRASSEKNGSCFYLKCDEKSLTGSISIPHTGGKDNWESIRVPDVELTEGEHILRLICENNGFYLNSLRFTVGSSTLPEGWLNQDIGNVSEIGNAGILNGIFYIQGSGRALGHDYYNEADELHFAYQKLRGDIEITARILSQTYSHDWGKAGIMIRESLDDKSKYASVAVTLLTNPVLYRRIETGGMSDLHNWHLRTDYNWLKLTRIGSTFRGYMSRDGMNWIELEESVEIAMNDEIYVGLAFTSHDDGIIGSATFENVRISKLH